MNRAKLLRTLGYGFLIWLIPFITAFAIFSIHETNRPLFESIMPVALCLSVIVFTVLYFRKYRDATVATGIKLGTLWMVMSLALDTPMFFGGPMQMTVPEYISDIGVTYFIILIVPIGLAWARRKPT